MKKLILIDGNAIMHRAYHALPPFKTSKGELVNCIYGFTSMLLNLMNKEKPEYIAVSFDTKAKTFRHEDYKDYKATRVKAPDDFYAQIPRVKQIVQTFNIPIYELDGFEADDVLGTLSVQAKNYPDIVTYIVTGDMDALQLVNDRVKVLSPAKGLNESVIYDTEKVLEKHGLSPNQVPDLKGLQGDSSDNIKGVQGIGPKTAKELLRKYGTIENVYSHLDEIKDSTKKKLEAGTEDAKFSKKLATIVTNVEVKLDLDKCKTSQYDKSKIMQLFEELEFKSLIRKLESFDNHYIQERAEDSKIQQSLF